MDFDYKTGPDGHQVVFTCYRNDGKHESRRVIEWLDSHGYSAFPGPITEMTWPNGREYQVVPDSEGVPIFIRLFGLQAADAMLLKLTFDGV